jgi:hypothetical protein
MKINYEEILVSKNCEFEGETSDGKPFVIVANFTVGDDDWIVDSIYWCEEEGTPEEEEQIIELFLSEING